MFIRRYYLTKKYSQKKFYNLFKKFLDRSDSLRCCHRTRYHKISPSTILTPQHYAVLASWIDKKTDSHYKIHNNPYKFDLLLSCHINENMDLPTFHSVCSKVKATLIISSIKDSDRLVGGYNPVG